MANINKIKLSGQTYDIQDPNASKTVELTQAQYDALTVKDPNTFYVITDAQGGDLSNYYTKSETSGATQLSTALASKQTTLTAGTNITIVDNVISATRGGKAVSGGTNISITTGETADTINCTLPITAGTRQDSVIMCNSSNIVNSTAALSLGTVTKANGQGSVAFGERTETNAPYSFTCGGYTITSNWYEFAGGKYNVSNTGSTDADNTLFSVGNGTANNARHNAFEIRQNGDIYCSDGTNDVKLQDTITATAANTTALGGLSLVKLTESEYAALVTKDSNTLYCVVPDPSN